ncbi:inorganic phosphate transporter [Zavarzinella formosa]|uniref:inorganic phosphate transporter n=1 Tax=Zavarzinella formosa TaxID=360055 RepID=UPI00030DDAD7|nr:inorganic phosphate transporter [Zavarzinella formosa]
MGSELVILVLVVVLALAFDYVNGFHDTANAVATVVSTGVMPPRTAVLLAAVCNFIGAFIGDGVAKTIGGNIAEPASITQVVVMSALLGAIIWNLLTWYFGIPSSSSHALIGGLVGAVWCHRVFNSVPAGTALRELMTSEGVVLALKGLVLSPLLGLLGGFVLMILLTWLVLPLKAITVNSGFRVLQLGSAGFMAVAHGSNDAQKAMGIITMALVSYSASKGEIMEMHVPFWVVVCCATSMALGTAAGGGRIMKTMGHKIIKLRPINGFAAETAAACVILAATKLDAPVSTTHVISSSIMGVGASRRVSAVRWGVAQNMLIAWVLTIPVSAMLAAVICAILRQVL